MKFLYFSISLLMGSAGELFWSLVVPKVLMGLVLTLSLTGISIAWSLRLLLLKRSSMGFQNLPNLLLIQPCGTYLSLLSYVLFILDFCVDLEC